MITRVHTSIDTATLTPVMAGVKRLAERRPSRRERARATQLKIVGAATRLFRERGYVRTTMADIATEAGVAVQTVYFVFHTKAELLSRAYDVAVMGEDEPRPPTEQPWFVSMLGEPEIAAAVRAFVSGVGAMTLRGAALYRIVRGAGNDPEVARVVALHEGWRAEGFRQILELLVSKASLRPGLAPERANQLLLLYLSDDVYHFLVDLYGWTHDEWLDWTVATLVWQIFGRSAGGSSGIS
ncbi:MAG TPA: helix-turn-helix domain-containing protein [Candidatus Limnocylindrales bacterium]|nr:helix-turn-helix domain-containing protein [Candidatus Limnocylindrales bacterium]